MKKANSFYREEALNKLKGRYADPILFTLLLLFTNFTINFISNKFAPQYDLNFNIVSEGVPWVVTLMNVVNLLVSGGLLFSTSSLFIDVAEGNSFQLGEKIKSGFSADFLRNVILNFLYSLFVALWSLLLLIPGIIKFYAYNMSFYLVVKEPELSAKDAIDKSKKMMQAHKMDLFMLDLSYLLWYVLGIFTLGILWLWIIPRHLTARRLFFNDIYKIDFVAPKDEYLFDEELL